VTPATDDRGRADHALPENAEASSALNFFGYESRAAGAQDLSAISISCGLMTLFEAIRPAAAAQFNWHRGPEMRASSTIWRYWASRSPSRSTGTLQPGCRKLSRSAMKRQAAFIEFVPGRSMAPYQKTLTP
jgi:hypothetical protein